MSENRTDVLFKKTVTLRSGGRVLDLRVAQDLFSSHRIDFGSGFLLRTLAETHPEPFHKILDLGCGYGPLGLALASASEESRVHLVDRDALAVDYARQNAALNGLDADVYGSLGYDDVTANDFDLIAANIPGKAGEAVIASFLEDAVHYLRPGGLVAIVVVSPLEPFVADILSRTEDIGVVLRKSRSGHAVFLYRFTGVVTGEPAGAFERGVYDRGEMTFDFGGFEYSLATARGLPEFDSRSFHTELLLEGLRGLDSSGIKSAVVFNPGLGHAAVVLWRILNPESIALVDRDLLSLRCSVKNLAGNGCPGECVIASHRVGIVPEDGDPADRFSNSTDLIIGVLREKAGPGWMRLMAGQATDRLGEGGLLMVSGRSTDVTRFAAAIEDGGRFKVTERKRWKGQSRLVLRRR